MIPYIEQLHQVIKFLRRDMSDVACASMLVTELICPNIRYNVKESINQYKGSLILQPMQLVKERNLSEDELVISIWYDMVITKQDRVSPTQLYNSYWGFYDFDDLEDLDDDYDS